MNLKTSMRPKAKPYDCRPSLGVRGPCKGAETAEGREGAQAVSPESRDVRSRGFFRVRRDLASHVETMRNREPEGASQKAAQLMSPELTGVEAKVSNELYESLKRVKALNWGTTRDTDTSFSRPKGRFNNLKKVALPKFGGKNEAWLDFKAILRKSIPALEMASLRHALQDEASKFIIGVSDTTEAFTLLDRKFGNRDMTNDYSPNHHRAPDAQDIQGPLAQAGGGFAAGHAISASIPKGGPSREVDAHWTRDDCKVCIKTVR